MINEPWFYVLAGTGFTFAMTALGAALVFLFRRPPSPLLTKLSLGFAAGIMIAASVWSLLIPAINKAQELGQIPAIPAAGGFLLGAAFLLLIDHILPHLHIGSKSPEGPHSNLDKSTLLFLAVTIHNLPEGMAVGISFASAALIGTPDALSAAFALALGIGIQNIPEGTAVSLPLHAAGLSRMKAFLMGSLSGLAEPIAAFIVVMLAGQFISVLPWALSFSAGAMLYVVVEELIPEAKLGEHSDLGTVAVLSGFVLMMILDTSLG